jgi:two-component system chemotaxis response regulator CheY
MRALIVDDSRANRLVIGRCLADFDFQAVDAVDGVDGLHCLKNAPQFDVLLVDWGMPGLNGLDFMRQVREVPAYASTPIIMISGLSSQDRIDEAIAAGANAYIVKPFTKQALAAKFDLLGIAYKGAGGSK